MDQSTLTRNQTDVKSDSVDSVLCGISLRGNGNCPVVRLFHQVLTIG